MDHQILLAKLDQYGIRGLPGELLRSYLTDRSQITIVNGQKSTPEEVTCGVPQGSILGPLLFNLYINDLTAASDLTVRLYADDACLTFCHKNISILKNKVNTELILVSDWLKVNKLSINYSKSNYMIFNNTKLKQNLFIEIDGNKLQKINVINYLGVHLDDKLNWKKHLEHVEMKLSKASYLISKIRHYVDLPTLKMLYYSLAFSHINYCLSAWGGTYKSATMPIFKLQKKIIRIITKSPFNAHSNPLFFNLKILPFKYLYFFNLAILFYKINHSKIVGTYNLTPINKIHNYNTRISKDNNYFQIYNRLNVGQNSCTNRGLHVWRKIPGEYKQLHIQNFKYKMKKYLYELLEKDEL